MVSCERAASTDTAALKDVWLTCFEEAPQAADLFFERNINHLHGYKATQDGAIIAAVYLIDCTLCGRQAHYLCGAATLPEHRGQGVMSRLIDFALRDAKGRGDVYSILYPANEGLYDFYARLGYQPNGTVRTLSLSREDLDDSTPLACDSGNAIEWYRETVDFAQDYYGVYGAKTLTSPNALVMLEQDGDAAFVIYAIYKEKQDLFAVLRTVGAERTILTGSSGNPLFADAPDERCGMLRALTDDPSPDDVYIGITLS